MARIRTIKPDFWKNEMLSSISIDSHFIAGALINYSDDDGYFNANPSLIKAECSPLRELSLSIHGILSELSMIGYVQLGTSNDGRTYGKIVNFKEHQRVNRPYPSKIKDLQIEWLPFTEHSLNVHGTFTTGIKKRNRNKETTLSSNGARPHIPFEEIITDLNTITGKHFSFTAKATQRLIQARFNEGRTLEDFRKVHQNKAPWKDDPKFCAYLRPETLYAASHFESYLNEDNPDPEAWRYE